RRDLHALSLFRIESRAAVGSAEMLLVGGVQTAFLLGRTAPAARSLVFAKHHGSRAGPAADACVALIVQRIIWNVLLRNQLPDVFLGPIGQGADLHQGELFVPAHDRYACPVAGPLIAPDATHPGLPAQDRLPEDFHLAIKAALIGVGFVKRS